MIKKLKSQSGLTITELMVTLLIFSMISSAVLVGISTSFAVRRDSILVSDAEILKSTVSQILKQELRFSSEQHYPNDGGKFDEDIYNISDADTAVVDKWYVAYRGGVPVTGQGNEIARIGLNENGYLMKRVANNEADTKPYQLLSSAAYGDPEHTHSSFSSTLFIDNLKMAESDTAPGNISVCFDIFSGDKTDEEEDVKILSTEFTVVPMNK